MQVPIFIVLMMSRERKQAIDWEKIFAKDALDKGLLSKTYKELLKLNNKKATQLKNGTRDLTPHESRYIDGK